MVHPWAAPRCSRLHRLLRRMNPLPPSAAGFQTRESRLPDDGFKGFEHLYSMNAALEESFHFLP